eukprot:PhM_4_TR3371/c0_g1_i1/m.4402
MSSSRLDPSTPTEEFLLTHVLGSANRFPVFTNNKHYLSRFLSIVQPRWPTVGHWQRAFNTTAAITDNKSVQLQHVRAELVNKKENGFDGADGLRLLMACANAARRDAALTVYATMNSESHIRKTSAAAAPPPRHNDHNRRREAAEEDYRAWCARQELKAHNKALKESTAALKRRAEKENAKANSDEAFRVWVERKKREKVLRSQSCCALLHQKRAEAWNPTVEHPLDVSDEYDYFL